VVEHSGAFLGQRIAMNDMQDRCVVVGIEPPARELERRPLTHLEPEKVAIKPARRLEVVAQDGEMVHRSDTHRKNSLTLAVDMADAYPEAGCGVNERVDDAVVAQLPQIFGTDSAKIDA